VLTASGQIAHWAGRACMARPRSWTAPPAAPALGQDLVSLNSRPWAASAQMTKMSRVMMSSDQNG
jgi:hypothetical protein